MSETKQRPSRPNRFGFGMLAVIQIVLLFMTLLFVNFLASQNPVRADFSKTKDYTLSGSTVNYLTSETVQERDRPVSWTMLFRRSAPFYERIRGLAEEYERRSGRKIELEVVDPIRSPERTEEVIAKYSLTLGQDLIVMDARPDDGEAIVRESEEGSSSLNPHITLALADEMLTFVTTPEGERRPGVFRGEDVLTARLVEAIEGKPKTFLFLADKSRIDSGDEESAWSYLSNTLRYQNIQLRAASMAGLKEVPEDVNGVAIVAPSYDFTEEEIAVLEGYWNEPKAALFILLEAGRCPPRLRTFLRSQGITPRRDRIIAKPGDRTISTVRAVFTSGTGFLDELAGRTTLFEGASSSLDVREGAADLSLRAVAPVPLVEAEGGYWGERDFGKVMEGEDGPMYDPIRDAAAPLYLAAAVTRGASNKDGLSASTSRMVVISNTDFLDPNRQQAENIDFLASVANWLVLRENLTGLGSRTIGTYKLPLLEVQVSFLNRLNLFFAPAAFLLIGGIIFSMRRS